MVQCFQAVVLLQKKELTMIASGRGGGLGGKYQITPDALLKADYYHVQG